MAGSSLSDLSHAGYKLFTEGIVVVEIGTKSSVPAGCVKNCLTARTRATKTLAIS